MDSGKFKQFITHPAFISLFLLTILLFIVPVRFQKYRTKSVQTIFPQPNVSFFYSDLDSDGNSELLSLDLYDKMQTKIIVSRDAKIIKQYDLRFQPLIYRPPFIGDFNSDGFKEIFVFTLNDDSIFLNIIDPLKSKKIIVANRFIDIRRENPNSMDSPNIVPLGLAERNGVRTRDLVFFINTGYSLQPRNLYIYNTSTDSLVKSPESGAVITGCIIEDLDSDSGPEFILSTLGTGNLEKSFPYTDNYSWLMVLNENLSFRFLPKILGPAPSRALVLPIAKSGNKGLIALYAPMGSEDPGQGLYLFDSQGSEIIIRKIPDFEPEISNIFPGTDPGRETFYFLKDSKTTVAEMNNSFRTLRTLKIPEVATGEVYYEIDADLDGKREYFFMGANRNTMVISKENFRNAVLWKHSRYNQTPLITQYLKAGEKPVIYAQFEEMGIFFRYEKNPFYLLKYPYYPALFGLLYLFVILIARAQRYRLNITKEHEKELVKLQLKAIKNQIDPHFTLNVLNAIGSLYSDEGKREKADYIFAKYAKLIRQTVISSDKVIVTIEEELDFVRNYLEIEKFRYGNSFDFSIDIREGSDIKAIIPRMLIHTFVENAVKYGIRNMADGGMLKIKLQKNDNTQTIIIENNGPFLEAGNPSLNGTGKGLMILNELIGMFQKLENIRISYNVEYIPNVSPENNINRATLLIPCMA